MKIKQIVEAPKKKGNAYPDPVTKEDSAYEKLQNLLRYTHGKAPANSYQLFMPRPSVLQKGRHDLLGNKYAWDDEGNLKPAYKKYESIGEAAPILPGKSVTPPGNNKPNASLWTSTAYKLPDGSYASDWAKWVGVNMPKWFSTEGYLYKVSSNCRVLELDSDTDAEQIYMLYNEMGAGNVKYFDYEDQSAFGPTMTRDFPWDWVAKHFDCVHHNGYSWHGEFMRGWDVESTAWFDTSVLTLVGKVKIGNPEDFRDKD